MQGPVAENQSSTLINNTAVPSQGLIRAIVFLHSIQWVAAWISSYATMGSANLQSFHTTYWGVDVFFGILAAVILLGTGCGPVAVKRTPVQWLCYVFLTASILYLSSTVTSLFNSLKTFYVISAGLGASVGALIYCLSTKSVLTLAGSFLYIVAGVAIFYQGFIIFTDLNIMWFLIVVSVLCVIGGLYIIYDTANVLTGTFYGLQSGQGWTGADLLWLEYILFPLRIVAALGGAFRSGL